jgi:hypothetical protein
MTILLHGAALSPFAFRHNKPSQSHTGIQTLNQVPRQDGGRRATLVPAPGVYFKVGQCIFFCLRAAKWLRR